MTSEDTVKMSHFKFGDMVEWESTSFGITTKKQGRVVAVIPPNDSRFAEYMEKASAASGGARFSSGGSHGLPRDHESYIVHVSSPVKGKLYWPRVKNLRKVTS